MNETAKPSKLPTLRLRAVATIAAICTALALLAGLLWDNDAAATSILVGATVAYAGLTVMLVRSSQEQIEASNISAKWSAATADASVAMAREATRSASAAAAAADAAISMARESGRSRIAAPQVAVDVDPDFEGPFVITHIVNRPSANDARMWDATNRHSQQPIDVLGEFVVSESEGVLIWFRVKIRVQNTGTVPALIELSGEMRFIDADSDTTLNSSTTIPPTVMSSTGRRSRLDPGNVGVIEWYDCVEAKASIVNNAGMYTAIAILDHASSVFQWVPIEAGAHPLEFLPGSAILVRPAVDPLFGATVHRHLVWFPHEGIPRPMLPWNT